MFSYIWPLALLIFTNTVYQICAKSMPQNVDPFASLTITYAISAVTCAALFFTIGNGGNILDEYSKVNWVPFAFGIIIVGLEVGSVFAYRAGWQVSMEFIVQSAFLAVVLVIVGFLLYKEELTWNKLVGVAFCLLGLIFINYNKA